MKILFLDVDGVMNSHRTAVGIGGFGYMAKGILNMTDIEVRAATKWDPVAVGMLKRLLKETRCKVVVSSVWRKGATLKELRWLFQAYGLPKSAVIGKTGSHRSGFRGREIRQWFADHRHLVIKDYLILDDDSDFFKYQKPRLVKTKHEIGFGFHEFQFIRQRWYKPKPIKKVSTCISMATIVRSC